VPGRLFPITLQFRPPGNENQFSKENSTNKRINPMPVLRTLQLIDSKYKSSDRGDLLVFLSGMSEIQTWAGNTDILSIYRQIMKKEFFCRY
jgi:ATP-dependent RNA helicase DHX34